ncbi:hypothetical protein ACFE04_008642 [Oxalis oulophora]
MSLLPEGQKIVAYTDHQALVTIRQDSSKCSYRVVRQLITLHEFNIRAIHHVKAEDNAVADTLSRYFKDVVCPYSEYQVPLSTTQSPKILACNVVWSITTSSACQECKDAPTLYGSIRNIIAENKGDLIAKDFFGPLPIGRAGLEKILVVLDIFTKFVHLFPTKRSDTKTSIRCMEKYIDTYGPIRNILSDNATNFTSDAWTQHWHYKKVNIRHTSVYHPAANPAERVMKTLATSIRLQVHKKNHGSWPLLLPDIQATINATEHITTGVAPMVLQLQRRPGIKGKEDVVKIPDEEYKKIVVQVRDRVKKRLESRNRYYTEKHSKPTKLSAGDIVFVRTHNQSSKAHNYSRKLDKKWKGPYIVVQENAPNSYLLEEMETGAFISQHIENIKY